MRFKLQYYELLSSFAFKSNLRRYNKDIVFDASSDPGVLNSAVGRCRLTLSNPR